MHTTSTESTATSTSANTECATASSPATSPAATQESAALLATANPKNPFDQLAGEDKLAAVFERVSTRAFDETPVEQEKLERIRSFAACANNEQDLVYLQVHTMPEDACDACGLTRTMFSGSVHTIVSASYNLDAASEEMCGWQVEKLILLATHLGLGTCWVAGTYNKEKAEAALRLESEMPLQIVIPVGYATSPMPLKQRTIRAAVRRKAKSAEQMVAPGTAFDALSALAIGGLGAAKESDRQNAARILRARSGMEAVAAAPSAVCQQLTTFSFEGGVARANFGEKQDRRQAVDFGIAKLHFHLGVGEVGAWEPGQDGRYLVEQESEA